MIQKDMEERLYQILKAGNLGERIIAKYHKQSIEELAEVMTEGMATSKVGWFVDVLDSRNEVIGFKAICRAAFKAAILRLLQEANGQDRDERR